MGRCVGVDAGPASQEEKDVEPRGGMRCGGSGQWQRQLASPHLRLRADCVIAGKLLVDPAVALRAPAPASADAEEVARGDWVGEEGGKRRGSETVGRSLAISKGGHGQEPTARLPARSGRGLGLRGTQHRSVGPTTMEIRTSFG